MCTRSGHLDRSFILCYGVYRRSSMTSEILKAIYSIVQKIKWIYLLLILIIVYFTSSVLMATFEKGAPIVSKKVFWWYFITTAVPHGSSGYSPVSVGGRLTSVYIFFGGGVVFAATVLKLVGKLEETMSRKRKGMSHFKLENHVVLLGYAKGDTEELVEQLRADSNADWKIVLCSKRVEENPLPDEILFVHGDNTDEDVLKRACIEDASVIVIYGHTDERTIFVALAIHERIRQDARVIAHVTDRKSCRGLKQVDARIHCITSLRMPLISQEVTNPGATELIRNLVSHLEPATNYRINTPVGLPQGLTFMDLFLLFKNEYDATLIGIGEDCGADPKIILNPRGSFPITSGMSLFYLGGRRIDDEVEWRLLHPVEIEDRVA